MKEIWGSSIFLRLTGSRLVFGISGRRLGGDETPAVPVQPLSAGSLVLEERGTSFAMIFLVFLLGFSLGFPGGSSVFWFSWSFL